MVALLRLLLLAQLFTSAQEQVTTASAPPLECLDVEVRAYEVKLPVFSAPSNTSLPGPRTNSDVNKSRMPSAPRERSTVASRARDAGNVSTGPPPPISRRPSDTYHYEYRVRVKNVSPKKIKSILWEYQVTDTSGTTIISQRLFLCAMTVKSGKDKLLRAGTPSPPDRVVSSDSSEEQSQKQKVVINRVEYSDGSTWTRDGWKPEDLTTKGTDLRDGQCTPL